MPLAVPSVGSQPPGVMTTAPSEPSQVTSSETSSAAPPTSLSNEPSAEAETPGVTVVGPRPHAGQGADLEGRCSRAARAGAEVQLEVGLLQLHDETLFDRFGRGVVEDEITGRSRHPASGFGRWLTLRGLGVAGQRHGQIRILLDVELEVLCDERILRQHHHTRLVRARAPHRR